MNVPKTPDGRRRRPSSAASSNSDNKSMKLNQTIGERRKARKLARSTRKAAYLSTLPKERWKRILYRLHPKRVAKYWFSRQGAIMALKIVGVGIVAIFLLIVGLFAYFRKDLPKIKDISGGQVGGSITYYDRTGKTVLWTDYDAVKRIPVQTKQMSKYVREATVAVEDKDFYKHGAFDVRGIMRAGVHDVFGSGGEQGGSTITQQLVKNENGWNDDHSITRKIKEVILAVELEREYSKDDILTGYLNIAPYGSADLGVEAAARDYFNESADQLTLAQSAMLAAIPKAPTPFSPYSSPKYNPEVTSNVFDANGLISRQHYILDLMVQQGYITQQQADTAKKVDILKQIHPLQSKYNGIKAPWFVLAAKQQLINQRGAAAVSLGGWKVITTLNLDLQNKAENLVKDNYSHIQALTGGGADEEATVLEDVQTGQIQALVGGTDWTNPKYGQNNYAAGILIPPGSSFKPYDYTTLINNNNNVGAGSVIYDNQQPLPGYACTVHQLPPPKGHGNCLEDYDFIYPGAIPIRYALAGSRNVPAVKAMLMAVPGAADPNSGGTITAGDYKSVNKVISTATAMMDNPYVKGKTYNCFGDEKLTQKIQCGPASAIGDGAYLHLTDHVNGLSTLAREGKAIPETFILEVDGANGKPIYKWQQPKAEQVVRQDAAYIVDDMLSDPRATYLPGSCSATSCTTLAQGGYKFQRDMGGWHFAVKTGTTNDGYDGLMTSWSTKYAVVSWVGNHNRNVDLGKYGASMEQLTEPLTRGLMEAAHQGLKPVNWQKPSDIKTGPAFVLTHHIHYGDIEPSPSTDLYPSWYAGGSKPNSSVTIDKVSGNLATSCTPTLAKSTQYNGNANSFNVDIFHGGNPSVGDTSSSSLNNSHDSQAKDTVHNCDDTPPQVHLTVTQAGQQTDVCNKNCTISVLVKQGTHQLSGGSYHDSPVSSVTVTLNGKTIYSKKIPSDQTSQFQDYFTYTPTKNGSGSLEATAVDSVLYDGTYSTGTIQFTSPPNTQKLQNVTISRPDSNGVVTITWSGGTPNYTVNDASGTPITGCTSIPSTTCTVDTTNNSANISKVTVDDSNGDSATSS